MRSACGCLALLLTVGCQSADSHLVGDVSFPTHRIGAMREGLTNGDGTNGAHIIYINFDGASIQLGEDDSATNTSVIAKIAAAIPPSMPPLTAPASAAPPRSGSSWDF